MNDTAADDEAMRRYATELADLAIAAIPSWVRSRVEHVAEAWRPGLASELEPGIEAAVQAAGAEIGPAVRELLARDVDDQPMGPLQVLRRLTPYPTAVLRAADIPGVERDEQAVAAFPDDHYDLVPTSFADFGADVHEAGLRWGAAKAHTVLRRRRAEGRR